MHHLWTILVVAISTLPARLRDQYQARIRDEDTEAGIETVEIVVLTVFILGLAAIVIIALTTFVQDETGKILSPNG